MIQSLKISNYAILDNVELSFGSNLNIITGETGAGKSIILGALGLIMGKRADSKVLFDDKKKCVVEAIFKNFPQAVSDILKEEDYDDDEELIIRREIIPSGKSRAFVNDTPANLNLLQSISQNVIDLNSQFQLTDIFSKGFQLNLIDAFASQQPAVDTYRSSYKVYKGKVNELNALRAQESAQLKEIDFINFQRNELKEAELSADEQNSLESESTLLEQADDIHQLITETNYVIDESEKSLKETLQGLLNKWENFNSISENFQATYDKISETIESLDEVCDLSQKISTATDNDPTRLSEIRDRLDAIYRLQKKHGVQSIDDLLAIESELHERLNSYSSRTERIESLEKEIKNIEGKLRKSADKISNGRKKVFGKLEKTVNDKLSELAMPSAELKIDHALSDDLQSSGIDDIVFLFKTNKGSDFLPLKKVASGGESARLMLSLKTTVAGAMEMPTMIFDEIDTGVSGEVASKMGGILKELSQEHQLICITHSPQVASRADRHFFVSKEDTEDRTVTNVRVLKQDDKVLEIAKMLSGDPPSTFALDNAKDLLKTDVKG